MVVNPCASPVESGKHCIFFSLVAAKNPRGFYEPAIAHDGAAGQIRVALRDGMPPDGIPLVGFCFHHRTMWTVQCKFTLNGYLNGTG